MKISVSLPEEDVAALDEFARAAGLRSRSAALHRAITMLRLPQLEQDYEAAWDEWAASGEQEAWDTTSADGIADAAR
ncbi:ribbon-helix-helix domain-containing protein [Leekyejoonella antrihumi]|uniref:Ribbon-helix-helix protein, CopG family n=1 Tax=Leekyejoonella antrihumi TaxID=1660198 RepID=A0A563DS22_9MICO|nr:ribbon-helix-helix domain-containing protein [Leekyejoonella antrihumi]TWP32494.1 ribbon-helix-helix protein, CopG family [Leekyejoonella antrihumi]